MRFWLALFCTLLALGPARSARAGETPAPFASCTPDSLAALKASDYCVAFDGIKGDAEGERTRKYCTAFYQASIDALKAVCAHQKALVDIPAKYSAGQVPTPGMSGQKAEQFLLMNLSTDMQQQYATGELALLSAQRNLKSALQGFGEAGKRLMNYGLNIMDLEANPVTCGKPSLKPAAVYVGIASGTVAQAGESHNNMNAVLEVFLANANRNKGIFAGHAQMARTRYDALIISGRAVPAVPGAGAPLPAGTNPSLPVPGTPASAPKTSAESGNPLTDFLTGILNGSKMESLQRTADRLTEMGIVRAARTELAKAMMSTASLDAGFVDRLLGSAHTLLGGVFIVGGLGLDVAGRILDHGKLDLVDYAFLGAKLIASIGLAVGEFGTGVGSFVATVTLEGIFTVAETLVRSLLDKYRDERLKVYLVDVQQRLKITKQDMPATSRQLSSIYACDLQQQQQYLDRTGQSLPAGIFVTFRESLDQQIRAAYAQCCAGQSPAGIQ
jgi:hypothetical protein